MNTFKTIRIKNATFSRHCFYIDTNMYLHDGIFNELNNKVQHFQGFGQSKLLYWFISLKFSEKKKAFFHKHFTDKIRLVGQETEKFNL